MKNLFFTLAAFLVFGVATAQTDPQKKQNATDTTASQKTTDQKNMKKEATKTHDHVKTTRKQKTTTKDTISNVDKRRNP